MHPEDYIPESEQTHIITEQHVMFFLVFMGVLSITFAFLFLIDFLPEKPSEHVVESATIESPSDRNVTTDDSETTPAKQEFAEAISEPLLSPEPIAIIFDTLDKKVTVLNPKDRSIAALDDALLSGVVRHPDSADFENEGTVFLFGHSSYLPHVVNKNFQAFNGIQNLTWGDTIRLQSHDTEYVYRVDRVYQAQASDAEVRIERGEAKLTLATCNTFGSKDDRYIVEATLIDSYGI